MEAAEFASRHERLLRTLDELVDLLVAGGDEQWAAWLSGDRRRIAGGDRHGLDHLLQAYGGMGSFNDVQLRHGDEQLQEMRSLAYEDSAALRRDLDAS